ncbi:MAG: Flp pilus assembly protein CpaB [Candidatus Nanopelagicales bacterium]
MGSSSRARSTDAGRFLRRHRRLLAGAAAGTSILAMGVALQPPAPPTRPVVVAATNLASGQVLGAEDLTVAQVPAGVLPTGIHTDPRELTGSVLGAPLAEGEPVTSHRLAPGPPWSVPAGMLPLPVRFADAAAGRLLSAGQRIDILAAAGPGLDAPVSFAGAEVVARDVLVLMVSAEDVNSGGILSGGGPQESSVPLVVLAADSSTGAAIAGAQARASLTFQLHTRPG